MPRIRPAMTGAVEVNPPMPSTTCGWNFRKIPRQSERLSLNRRTNARIAGERGEGKPTVGSFSNPKLSPPFDREGVDLLFRNEKEHFVPALAQNFRHRETGKEMPACSSTCNYGVHGIAEVDC